MTGRERILSTIAGKDVDRIAVSPFIHANHIREFYKNNNVDINEKTPEIYRYYGFDIMHRNCGVDFGYGKNTDNWKVSRSVFENGSDKYITTLIITPEKTLKQVIEEKRIYEFETVKAEIECFIKDRDDFRQFLKYQPDVEEMDMSPVIKAKQLTGEDGVVAPWFSGGAFNYLCSMRKLDQVMMDALLDNEFYSEMMEYFTARIISTALCFKRAGADILSYGGNIATGSMVGPGFFRDHVLDYEKKIIRSIQDENMCVLYHNCGDASAMFECYNDTGFLGYESLTPPPYGDTILADALKRLRPEITLFGGFDQISLLRYGSIREIQDKVKEMCVLASKRGRFVLGTSDYFNEATPVGNILAFAEAGIKYGRGQ